MDVFFFWKFIKRFIETVSRSFHQICSDWPWKFFFTSKERQTKGGRAARLYDTLRKPKNATMLSFKLFHSIEQTGFKNYASLAIGSKIWICRRVQYLKRIFLQLKKYTNWLWNYIIILGVIYRPQEILISAELRYFLDLSTI